MVSSMPQSITAKPHKNKTLTTLLAFVFGWVGLHRFYLRGIADKWGWAHAASIPLSSLILVAAPTVAFFFSIGPVIVSALVAIIETLVIGLTPDDKWDAKYNAESGRSSDSRWPLALLLVFAVGVGATALIASIARSFDLLFTGGAFG